MRGRSRSSGLAGETCPTGGRRLGLPSAAALVIANMVGTGVFTISGFALADLGRPEPVLAAWGLGGLLALCGALSYGALARRFPQSGGEYSLLSHTVHPLAGFLAGWVSLLAGFTAPIAAAALGLQAYLAAAVGGRWSPEWVGTAAILVAGALHGVRRRLGVSVQNAAVALELILIAGFVAAGALHLPASTEPATALSRAPTLGAFAVTLVWVSFAYSGWNAAVYVAGEVRDPERNLNRSLLLATAIVTVAYVALNAVFLHAAAPSVLAGTAEIGAVAAEAIGGPRLRLVVSLLVALALFTSMSSMVMAGPRVYARMAQDGFLPRLVGAGGDAPAAAVALQVALAIIVVWIATLAELLSYIGFTLGLSAAATVAGAFGLRRREGAERFSLPGYPVVPVLFIAATVAASSFMAARQPVEAALGLLTVAAGVPIYWLRGHGSRAARPPGWRASTPPYGRGCP